MLIVSLALRRAMLEGSFLAEIRWPSIPDETATENRNCH